MIYVECKPDQTLVQGVTRLPLRQVIHELQGKGRVVYQVRRGSHSVGLVDEDPGATQPRLLTEMPTVEDLLERAMQVKQDSRGNRIVVLRPRLEEWIVRAARDAGVELSRYGLSDDPLALHKVINAHPSSFQRLVEDLRNTERLRALRRLLDLRRGPSKCQTF